MRESHVGRHPHAAALAAYVAIAAAAAWPLLARFGSAVAGQGIDPWRTLWRLWWWSDGLGHGVSPLSCDASRWPEACGGWFDLPATTALLPVWLAAPLVGEPATYNAAMVLGHALAGFAVYMLCREIWGGLLAPFLSGALYVVGAAHLGLGLGDPHVLSMAWTPLYLVALMRTVRWHGMAAPLLAGLALGAAALASPYQLASCCLGTVVLLLGWMRSERASIASGPFARRAALLAAVAVLVSGWAYAGAWRSHLAPEQSAAGASATGSADLLAFFVPGATSVWRADDAVARGDPAWAAYVGWIAIALAVVAAVRAKAARPWLALGVAGLLLSLGPRLHVGGRGVGWPLLPFGWFERVVPALRGEADPARFAALARLGVAVAGGAALSLLVRRGRRGPLLATAVVVLALVESWPRPVATPAWPAPRFLRDLSKDTERWAVLDTTEPARRLWNQVLHRHPQLGAPGAGGAPVPAALRPLVAGEAAPVTFRAAVEALQLMNVRFVVADAATLAAVGSLRLARAYEGGGMVVFEVPPAIQMAARPPSR